jgi:hypothetical protein
MINESGQNTSADNAQHYECRTPLAGADTSLAGSGIERNGNGPDGTDCSATVSAKNIGAAHLEVPQCQCGEVRPEAFDKKVYRSRWAPFRFARWRKQCRACSLEQLRAAIRDRSIPEPNTGCWLWLGTGYRGYGSTRVPGWRRRTYPAHRVSFIAFRGPIPSGLTLDHLCRVKCCVNPDHLEPVTGAENSRRANVLRPNCLRGHPITTLPTGRRVCRRCRADAQLKYTKLLPSAHPPTPAGIGQ